VGMGNAESMLAPPAEESTESIASGVSMLAGAGCDHSVQV
jgi:hypothetical protein